MSLRPLLAMLIAFAMLLGPLAMPAGAALAATAAGDLHAPAMGKSHCAGQPAKDAKAHTKSCCAAMCTAISIAPVATATPLAFARTAQRPGLARIGLSFLVKLPTPPPRLA